MSKETLSLGKRGEEAALGLLKKNGYRIIARNYKTKMGEIDIIARDRDSLCFVEVKTRSSQNFGQSSEAVVGLKQRRIAKTALCFLKENNLLSRRARFDVVSVSCAKGQEKLDLIKNAFELDPEYSY